MCIELVHIIEFQCNPNQTKSWEEKDNTFYLCHDCWAIEIITAGLFQMIFKKKKNKKKNVEICLFKKGTNPHRQVTILYVFLDSRVAIYFILFFFFKLSRSFGIRFKFNPNLSTAGPHTKQTHTAGETPPKQPTHQKTKRRRKNFLLLSFLNFFLSKKNSTKRLAEQTTPARLTDYAVVFFFSFFLF